MARTRPRGAWLSPLADTAIFAACLAAPLAVGGVYLWAQHLLLGLSALAFGATALNQWRRGHPFSLGLLAALPAAMAALCALQLVPLPDALLRWLTPTGHELLTTTLPALGVSGWHGTSLDPPATALELGKAVLYLLLVLAAFVRGREPHGGKRLLQAVAWSGAATLILTAVQSLGRVGQPYGVFGSPSGALLITPFVNPNHAAGFFGIAACAATGIALSQRDRARAGLWALAAVLLGATVPLTLSRGGMLALLATLIFGAWMLYARSRSERASLWWVHLGVGVLVAVAAYLAYQPIVDELATLDPNNLQGDKRYLWREALAMAPSFALTGAGRGAFARVFPAFKSNLHTLSFEFAESAPIQWLVDFGLIAGSALLLAVAVGFALVLRRAWQRRRVAALIALFYALVHNLVDFNLEIPGVAIPLLLVGVMLSDRRRNGSDGSRPRRWSVPAPVALAIGAVLVALSAACLQHGHRHDGRALDAAIAAARDPATQATLAAQGLREHPTDYLYALTLARTHLAATPPEPQRALRWLNRALRLNPTHAPTYRLTARTLWSLGARGQALENWRRAVTLQPAQQRSVLDELLRLDARYPELETGLPEDKMLALCQALQQRRRGEEAWACIEAHLGRATDDVEAVATAARWALGDPSPGRAEQLLARLRELAPRDVRGHLLQGQLEQRQGQPARAVATWQQALPGVDDPGPLLGALFEQALRDKRFVDAREALDGLRRRGAHSPAEAAALHLQAGRMYLAQDMAARGLREFETALALTPSSPSALQAVAECEERLGRLDRAIERYQALQRLRPSSTWVGERLRRLEAARATRAEAARWQELRGVDAGAGDR